MSCECCLFFFSSRRRHTRFDCDWSSDVCSSDLTLCDGSRSGSRARNSNTGKRVFELVDGEIQSRDRQRKHPLTHELARAAHPCCALLLALMCHSCSGRASERAIRSSVATYWSVPVKR